MRTKLPVRRHDHDPVGLRVQYVEIARAIERDGPNAAERLPVFAVEGPGGVHGVRGRCEHDVGAVERASRAAGTGRPGGVATRQGKEEGSGSQGR